MIACAVISWLWVNYFGLLVFGSRVLEEVVGEVEADFIIRQRLIGAIDEATVSHASLGSPALILDYLHNIRDINLIEPGIPELLGQLAIFPGGLAIQVG